ncbi:NAD(P)/FAD-dependent oxidoreductase [Flavobacteriaceae bacterium]|nr:NAD(P)/FAD-dependent oxidoreductase [Flavobacteriaceae bacterium]
MQKKVAIIGGGAAGFFAALSVKEHHPHTEVHLYEKTSKVLSKVKVSGGGRCNVTNGTEDINTLIKAYPRGGKQLKNIFYRFNTKDTFRWFESRGVALKTESDGRVFPVSDNSQSIIDCILKEAEKLDVTVHLNSAVTRLEKKDSQWEINFNKSETPLVFDAVLIATGGSPKESGFNWIRELGHTIKTPVPSLFTFNLPKEPITKLMGLAVETAKVKIKGFGIETKGPLLVTHWGFSGPAILLASSFGARKLAESNYQFEIEVNWLEEQNTEKIYQHLQEIIRQYPKKMIASQKGFQIPQRLWQFLIAKANISADKRWNELGKKNTRILIELLTKDHYTVSGKTTFKEEFVTCGGVALEAIHLNTLESKTSKGIYFAGEVIDIDAVTGGYNFQAAWSTGYIAGKLEIN